MLTIMKKLYISLRVFSSKRRLKKYGLDGLEYDKLVELKHYLIEHAADSKQPVVPGL